MGCILSYHPTLLSCSAIPTFMFVDDIFLQQVHTWIEVAYACGKTYANCCEVWKCSVSLSPKQLASVYGYLSLHCWSLASHSSSVSESRLCLALSLHHTSFSVLPISHPARAMCTNVHSLWVLWYNKILFLSCSWRYWIRTYICVINSQWLSPISSQPHSTR